MEPRERRTRTSRATASAVTRVSKTREQFQELTGYQAESVSGLAKVGNGWTVELDVVEVRRVPDLGPSAPCSPGDVDQSPNSTPVTP
jgi:Gas vesicle synthesis protein GvpO